MNNIRKSHFKFDWVLVDDIAIGTVPTKLIHLEKLKKEGIKGVLNLCGEEEAKCIDNLNDSFAFKRVILPDHRQKKLLTKDNIISALNELEKLLTKLLILFEDNKSGIFTIIYILYYNIIYLYVNTATIIFTCYCCFTTSFNFTYLIRSYSQ